MQFNNPERGGIFITGYQILYRIVLKFDCVSKFIIFVVVYGIVVVIEYPKPCPERVCHEEDRKICIQSN